MIIPLHHGKMGSARTRRFWPSRATPRRAVHLGQEAGQLVDSAIAGLDRFKLLFVSTIILLVFELIILQITGRVLASLIIIYLASNRLAIRHWGQACKRRARLQERAAQQERSCREREWLDRAANWQRLNLRVGECETNNALERLATERARAITSAGTLVQL